LHNALAPHELLGVRRLDAAFPTTKIDRAKLNLVSCHRTQIAERRIAMKRTSLVLAVLALAVFLVAPSSKAGANGQAGFDLLKSLIGHWQEATPTDSKASMDIELTANGSAILERFHMVQGTKPVEMTTLYYLDGDQLKMTHYCMAG